MKVKKLTKLFIEISLDSQKIVLTLLFSLFITNLLAQTSISGKVISKEDGIGLPGVSIVIKGTTTGTSTDLDGIYHLDAKPEDVLVFSFIGFKYVEQTVGNRAIIDIEMEEDVAALNEIIVTGYSQKSQKELSAAVVSLSIEEVQSVTSPNIESMLQGKVAGLTVNSSTGQPGAPPDIRLRGITSINADRSPLIVVDGMIGGNYVPSDVETITVLKDAAAIGLFGSRGAAGVIIITTKQATSSEPEFQFATSIGLKQATTGNFRMMNGQEIYDTQEIMWGADRIGFLANRPQELRDQDFNWLDAGFRNAWIQNYNFAARGKAEKLAYTFNVDYFDEEGTFINTDFQRLNLHAGTKFDASKNFTIATDINVQFDQDQSNHYSWFEDAFYSLPWDDPYYADGNTKFVNSSSFTGDWYGQFRRNFLNSTKYNSLVSSGLDVVWSTRLLFNITDWLSIETRTRINGYNNRFDQYYSPNTHEGIQFNGIVGTEQVAGRGILSTHFIRLNKSFGDHDLSGFIAHEGASSSFQTLSTEVTNLAPSIKVPAGGSVNAAIGGFDQSFSSISFIGEANYGYKGKYFGTFVFRVDGSSVFAENNRFASFPSGSFAWLMSEENFMQGASSINLLKLRLSYGLVGNDGLGAASGPQAYAYLPTYNITRQYNGQPGGAPDNPANSDLGWETSTIANLGIDLGILSGDLNIAVDAYQKSVDGMLFFNPLAYSQGYEARWENIGAMRNNGIELSLDYAKPFGDWNYSGNFNISYNDNQITFVSDVTDQQILSSGPVQQVNKVGLEAFMWYMPRWLGVDPANGAPIWEKVEADGSVSPTSVYNEATFQPIESALPKISGGMTNNISYKNITLSILLTYQAGNHIYHSTREFIDSDGADLGINMMAMQEGWTRWRQPGDIATHPILTKGDKDGSHFTSSRYLEKGDYLRIRNISLSYSLPQSVLSWAKIKTASLALSADNLFTFTKFSGMDPDINMTVRPFELPGMSFLKYPISKQYIIRLNINF